MKIRAIYLGWLCLTGGLSWAQSAPGPALQELPLGSSFGKSGTRFTSVLPDKPAQILVGFQIVKATIIEGIIPLTSELGTDGQLKKSTPGPSFGRKIPEPLNLEKPGYYVSGLVLYEGLWYGQEAVKQIQVKWTKWGGKDTLESPLYGIGKEKYDQGRSVSLQVPLGQVARGIHGLSSPGMLNRLSLVLSQNPQTVPTPPQNLTGPQGPGAPSGPRIPEESRIPGPTAPPPPRTEKPESQDSRTPMFRGLPQGSENIPQENASFENQVLNLVNQERAKAGLKPVAWDEALARAARYHAADMTEERYFDHNSMDRSGSSLIRQGGAFDRIHRFSNRGHSENIAQGQRTPEEVMKSWMNSPGHKANILAPRSTLLGVGFVKNTWVQVFGS